MSVKINISAFEYYKYDEQFLGSHKKFGCYAFVYAIANESCTYLLFSR